VSDLRGHEREDRSHRGDHGDRGDLPSAARDAAGLRDGGEGGGEQPDGAPDGDGSGGNRTTEITFGSGTTPVELEISLTNGRVVRIDLDEPGWAGTYRDELASDATWFLFWKDSSRPPFVMTVGPDDEPRYAARHIGLTGSGGSNEIVAYGIGKVNRRTGVSTMLWNLPGGAICAGDDVDQLGVNIVRALGPRPVGT
jgi:hypothetical protein